MHSVTTRRHHDTSVRWRIQLPRSWNFNKHINCGFLQLFKDCAELDPGFLESQRKLLKILNFDCMRMSCYFSWRVFSRCLGFCVGLRSVRYQNSSIPSRSVVMISSNHGSVLLLTQQVYASTFSSVADDTNPKRGNKHSNAYHKQSDSPSSSPPISL